MIVISLELALSIVNMQSLSMPHPNNHVSMAWAITSPWWGVRTTQKLMIFFCSFQSLSINCDVRHTYPRFWIEVHKSMVSDTCETEFLKISFNFCFSFKYISTQSLVTIVQDTNWNFGYNTLQNLLRPSFSTKLNGNSSIIIILATSLW